MATLMLRGNHPHDQIPDPKDAQNYKNNAGDQDDRHRAAKGELAALDHAAQQKLVPMPVDRAKGKLE